MSREASVPVTGRNRFTDLSTDFEGEDWDYVLEKKSTRLTNAFKLAAANALGVQPNDITVLEFVMKGGLLVQFRVQHSANLGEMEIRQKVDAYPFDEVWALYEGRPAAVRTTHDVGFEADNWEYVDRMKHDQIVDCFTRATATACEVPVAQVKNVKVVTYPHMMKITCDITHPTNVFASQINSLLYRQEYEEVWDLYEEPPVGKESGLLSKKFEGDDWDHTVEQQERAVRQAFANDTSKALKISRSAVTIKELKLGSLTVDYTVRTNDKADEDIRALVDTYPYPETWAVYKPRQTTRNAPQPAYLQGYRLGHRGGEEARGAEGGLRGGHRGDAGGR
ncbi:mitotubule-associated protein Gb4 [Angomonas deanei]|uniref:Flagellar attachment zone protein 1 conserved domain-containing protein n=1 Tax=Angomonas deanei TaxID=59799 RepID=A0A7G2CN66_9TRYP|nr:mitotubule-associated protein Gb4 [Angomonas deanei]CAD2221276.1 hypothetical protein, conserved [Angomonas deanei]|eukprot:EPY18406.1 mitotubule-associated protein Gb4 [Angomonas deanei]